MTQFPTQNQSYFYPNGSQYCVNTGIDTKNMQPVQTLQTVTPCVNPYTSQIYNYPTASVYGQTQTQMQMPSQPMQVQTQPAQSQQNGQPASGVNIYIYNPSAIGAPSSSASANYNIVPPNCNAQAPVQPQQTQLQSQTQTQPAPVAQEQTKEPEEKKTKKIIALTNEYIKSLENYLRSPDPKVRKTGITDLIKRFEEDESRYEDPALTALLNIALQDPVAQNRVLAMTPITVEKAHGDQNTIQILSNLEKSDKLYGQEAKTANEALLKAVQTYTTIADNSPSKNEKEKSN